LGRILQARYYQRSGLDVAAGLIGKRLAVRRGRHLLTARITETEAYIGTDDPASHAWSGRRGLRNESMYARGGTVYVYFTYGNHYMLNVVVGRQDVPCAVLIRAAAAEEGIPHMTKNRGVGNVHRLLQGPGNLTRAFGIDKELDGAQFFGPVIWIEHARLPGTVKTSGRIGIGTRGAERPWRFYLAGHPSVSGPRRSAR
jgi:DNA-3-methyladenine glycosylase